VTFGIIIGKRRQFRWQLGLWSIDNHPPKQNVPHGAAKQQHLGGKRGDQVCGNLPVHLEDTSTLPCSRKGSENERATAQISDQPIIAINYIGDANVDYCAPGQHSI
jgi:hypothetical protein